MTEDMLYERLMEVRAIVDPRDRAAAQAEWDEAAFRLDAGWQIDQALDAVTGELTDEIDATDREAAGGLEVALLERLRDTSREWVAAQTLGAKGYDRWTGSTGATEAGTVIREADAVRGAIAELRERLARGRPLTEAEENHFWSFAWPTFEMVGDELVPF